MLKLAGENKETGRPVLGIGLTRENCDMLLEGRDIAFTAGALEIYIFARETELDLLQACPQQFGEQPEGSVS
jgi:hypothetical protein